jgi:hypothetical protein
MKEAIQQSIFRPSGIRCGADAGRERPMSWSGPASMLALIAHGATLVTQADNTVAQPLINADPMFLEIRLVSKISPIL